MSSDPAKATGVRALALETTKGCNLRCGYCYYAQREDAYDPAATMSSETAERSVELLLREASPGETVHVHFFGGEPLLNVPLLEHTILYAERRAVEEDRTVTFEVTTNGTRLDDDVIRLLNAHEVRVGVSFDGPPDVQDAARPGPGGGGSHARAVEGIRRLVASRRGSELAQRTHCSVVVTRRAMDLPRIVAHLESLGFERIILTPATDLTGSGDGIRPEDLPELLRAYDSLAEQCEQRLREGRHVAVTWFPTLLERISSGERRTHFCQGGRDYLGVDAGGGLSLCYRFFEDDAGAMGDVTNGVDRALTEKLLSRPLEQRRACSTCWARHYCGGGCHHDNLVSTGDLGEPNPVTCEILRHGMGRALETWARLSRDGAAPRVARAARRKDLKMPSEGDFAEDARPLRRPGCEVRDLGDEQIVYVPETHEVVVLNGTAALIFGLCDGRRSTTDLLAELERRYDAPADVLARDLRATLGDLRSKGALV